ncbi:hypothetical protein CYY_002905 [Polysphondylium violaceum]|uniref:Adenylyl cyclase n=1 Tax=Polysphondylium violaceum TaxID=133409 RepID=A0A8J4PZC1_9MYCE|nr:hypothetical protein CYY_002905 [Polysphondylium violaceum]
MCLSLFSFIHYSESEIHNTQMELERASKYLIHNIQMRALAMQATIESLNGLYQISPKIRFSPDPIDFFIKTIRKSNENNVMWVSKVFDNERLDFEKNLSSIYHRDIKLLDYDGIGQDYTESIYRPIHFPVSYIYPDNGRFEIGIDFLTSPTMAKTLKKTVENNIPTVHVVQKLLRGKNRDLIMLIPVYRNEFNESDSFEKKIENCIGLAAGLFLTQENIEASWSDTSFQNDFKFFLATSTGLIVYQPNTTNFSTLQQLQHLPIFESRLKYETKMQLEELELTVWVFTSPEYENSKKTFLPSIISLASCILLILTVFYLWEQRKKKAIIQKMMKEKSQLINKFLPIEVSMKLENGQDIVAERSNNACVFFLDIAGFTRFSSIHTPEQVIEVLILIFNSMDLLCAKHGIEKIKTIGDAYMATCGIFPKSDDIKENTTKMLVFALDVLRLVPKDLSFHLGLKVRVGVHCGPVISGVISGYAKPHFDVWGDTVNVASRMESTGIPGHIHVSDRVYQLTKEEFEYSEKFENINVKGKGLMKTWYLLGKVDHEFNLKKDFLEVKKYKDYKDGPPSSPYYESFLPDFHNIENTTVHTCGNCTKLLKKYQHDELNTPKPSCIKHRRNSRASLFQNTNIIDMNQSINLENSQNGINLPLSENNNQDINTMFPAIDSLDIQDNHDNHNNKDN